MAITRIAKGTAQLANLASTLTLSSVSCEQGDTLVVGLVCRNEEGVPDVAYGTRTMKKVVSRNSTASGRASAFYIIPYLRKAGTRDIVATWSGEIRSRAMFAVALRSSDGLKVDQSEGNIDGTATTTPSTGITPDLSFGKGVAIGLFGNNSSVNDTRGTIGDGFSAGQRDGNDTPNPVTLEEVYKEISGAAGMGISCDMSSAPSAQWVNGIIVLRSLEFNRYGISPSDVNWMRDFFEILDIDTDTAIFHYNDDDDTWELRTTTDLGTVVATQTLDQWWMKDGAYTTTSTTTTSTTTTTT